MRWSVKALGDVCEVVAGQSPDGAHYNEAGEGLPFYQGKKEFGERTIGAPRIWTREVTKEALAGDILMSVRAPVGPINYAASRCCIGRGLAAIRSKAGLEQEFLFYALLAKHSEIAGSEGAVFPSISKSQIEAVRVPVPPMSEQRRAIAILDEAFEGIAVAVANADKNRANARELFGAASASLLNNVDKSWMETTLGADVDLLVGFAFKSQRYSNAHDAIRLLRGDNVVQGALRWTDAKRWPVEDVDGYKEYLLQAGDIVLAMDRTWVKAGLKYAQLEPDDEPALLVQRVARLRCKPGLDDRFLMHVLGSQGFSAYVLDIQTGLGVPHISGKQIGAFRFRKPTLSMQRNVASKLDDLGSETRSLEAAYQDRITSLKGLKQSILRRAFAGELTSAEDIAA